VAGYREFQTGEVLTAANVNQFLMEQATMTFADDAARTAALAGVLREGLLTYNLDQGRLEVYNGTAWVEPAPEPPAGIGSNVVQAVRTAPLSLSSLGVYVDVTDVTLSITPSSATSKILLIASATINSTSESQNVVARLMRDSTEIAVGTSPGNRIVGSFGTNNSSNRRAANHGGIGITWLDSPNTTSAITYKMQVRCPFTVIVSQYFSGDNDANNISAPTVLTAIEVAG
jgi:hypothetical protein